MCASLLYHVEVVLQAGKEFHHKFSFLPSSRPESKVRWGSGIPCKDVPGGPELWEWEEGCSRKAWLEDIPVEHLFSKLHQRQVVRKMTHPLVSPGKAAPCPPGSPPTAV